MDLRPDSCEASSLLLRQTPNFLFTFYFDIRALDAVFDLELTLWSSLESVIPLPKPPE